MVAIGNNAWRVKEVQDHVGEGSDRGEHIRNAGHDLFVFGFCCDAIQDSQGTHCIFLGHFCGDDSDSALPVTETERRKDPGDRMTEGSHHGVFDVFYHSRPALNAEKNQMTTQTAKMMVPALMMKPRALSHIWMRTPFMDGKW